MNFDTAFERLLGHEGKYSNNPADPGGATCWGVTEVVARRAGYTGDMRELSQSFAKQHVYRSYWDSVRCDELPDALRFDVFDGCVNSGGVQATKWLQRAVGTTDDGVLGSKTLAALAAANGAVVASRYNGQRLMFMTSLKTWSVFSGGWARRIASNLMAA